MKVIAIDGPAGSGKSTLARALATALGWSFLDTGAMYRAITSEVLKRGIDPLREEEVGRIASECDIKTVPYVSINGRNVNDDIRSDVVNRWVSTVASYRIVREQMVERQRLFAQAQPEGTVVEGRDITTVVFPDATLKVFLTADVSERARRRGDESAESIERRDLLDSTRENSPLRRAEDAMEIDTTQRSVESIVEQIVLWLRTNHFH